MSGRARAGRATHAAGSGRTRAGLIGTALLAAALAAVVGLVGLGSGPAGAAAQTVDAQLSLSGLASPDNPLGGSQIGIHPGDKVTFSAAGVPTAGLDKLGLGSLLGGVLQLGATFQVTADFSGLPGGAKNTVLSGAQTKTFTFPSKGTYSFTWTAQQVSVLGVVPIALDGNQLAKAGVKLNASNQYVGSIVSATNPPPGGLSLQVPGVKVAPSAPVVGQLPTLSIPGVTLPTVGVSVPNLNPTAPSSAPSGKTTAPASTAPKTAAPTFAPPALSVPQMVLGAIGAGDSTGGSNSGGFRLGVDQTGGSQFGVAGSGTGSGASSAAGSSTGKGATSPGTTSTVDLASSATSPSSELPIVLAILAVLTLAVVAGTYARLYLLGRGHPQA